MGLSLVERRTMAHETRKINDDISIFDALLDRYSAFGAKRSSNARGRLVGEMRKAIRKLQRSRQALVVLLNKHGEERQDTLEMERTKALVQTRLVRHLKFERDFKKTPISHAALLPDDALRPEEQARVDALDLVMSGVEALQRHAESVDATIECLAAQKASAGSVDDVARNERMARLGELNDEREWHVERLEKVQRMLLNEEVTAKRVLRLKEPLEKVLDLDEDDALNTDHSIFLPFGLDIPESLNTGTLAGATTSGSKSRPLPLGADACADHFLRGACTTDCGRRHVLNQEDFAAGVDSREVCRRRPCLNFFLRGRCANGPECRARHALTKDDYDPAVLPAGPHRPTRNPTHKFIPPTHFPRSRPASSTGASFSPIETVVESIGIISLGQAGPSAGLTKAIKEEDDSS